MLIAQVNKKNQYQDLSPIFNKYAELFFDSYVTLNAGEGHASWPDLCFKSKLLLKHTGKSTRWSNGEEEDRTTNTVTGSSKWFK